MNVEFVKCKPKKKITKVRKCEEKWKFLKKVCKIDIIKKKHILSVKIYIAFFLKSFNGKKLIKNPLKLN